MKVFTIFLWLVGCNLVFTQLVEAKTVLDYYFELPDNLFRCDLNPNINKKYKSSLLTHQNIPNGYLTAQVEENQLQVAIFKDKTHQRDIIAVFLECGEICACGHRHFFTPNDQDLKEVTANFLPKMEESVQKRCKDCEIEYKLPEFGTTIEVIDIHANKPILKFEWEAGKFVPIQIP